MITITKKIKLIGLKPIIKPNFLKFINLKMLFLM